MCRREQQQRMRRDIYNAFDGNVGNATRFFGAAAMTVEFLANSDIPVFGSVFGPSSEAAEFLHGVSRELYSLNAKTYAEIIGGAVSGPGLDSKLVHAEQTAVQDGLDALSGER